MNSVRIELLGATFSIQTDESPEHLSELVAMVKKRIQLVQSQTSSTDPLKVAILASVMLADELQARPATPPLRPIGEPFSDDDEEAERIAMRLISDIDERLPR
jgi:hypothetical protein